MHIRRFLPLLATTLFLAFAGESAAQVAAPAGAVQTGLLLRELGQTGRVLMVGAHPDDEDTSLLAALARERGVRAAYLALTRGEGGQNLIGNELGEGLGIVRTGELLAARNLDGAEQFFTRAFDFGYSKRAEEALELWPREELLRDVVWVVRTFRPHVIVSIFTGTSADGHGQHQAAGIMAREAFEAAGDPERYPEQLTEGVRPWSPVKLYQLAWRNPDDADVAVESGTYDALLGRSAHQIAMEGRSQHRSQDMGAAQALGPASSRLTLVESRIGGAGLAAGTSVGRSGDLLAGLDTSLSGLMTSALAGEREVGIHLDAAERALSAVAGGLLAFAPDEATPALLEVATHLAQALDLADPRGALYRDLHERVHLATDATLAASGVVIDVRTSDDLVVPGQMFRVDVEVWNGGRQDLSAVTPTLELPPGAEARATDPPTQRRSFFGPPPPPPPENTRPWISDAVGEAQTVEAGSLGRWSFEVRWPEAGEVSHQYYLAEPKDGALYTWPEDRDLWGLPRNPEVLGARVALGMAGTRLEAATSARYRGVDKAKGEFTQPLLIAPAVSVSADPAIMIWPTNRTDPRTVNVTVSSFAADAVDGRIRLDGPDNWTVEPESQPFSLTGEGSSAAVTFRVFPNNGAEKGAFSFQAVATDRVGREYRERVAVVDYEHIPRTLQFFPASTDVSVFDVQIASGIRVGYVMGSGDFGVDAIRELGLEPQILDAAALESGDLNGFDVIVLGVRAYETRPDLVRNNERLLEFARAGGTLVVQYNKYEFPAGGFAPFEVTMNRPHDRVSVEEAPVSILAPDAPVLSAPNTITTQDFEGWVQERGLYFLGSWDPAMEPILEMADPGEEPKRGSLLVAPLGEGLYVYTGLSFFRQLPAGVPGAYRLFANLVSLRPELTS